MTSYVSISKMGMAMEEGTIVEWLVSDGESVEVGRPIYILNSDKIDTEIECQAAGTIHLLAEEGQTLPVGTPIAEVHEPR